MATAELRPCGDFGRGVNQRRWMKVIRPSSAAKAKQSTFADPLTGNLAETATVKPWQLKSGAVRHCTQGEGGNPLRIEGLTFACPLTGDSAAW